MLHVSNLRDGEEVCHALVLLRGHVTSRDIEEGMVSPDVSVTVGGVVTNSPVTAGSFKLLVELQPGDNGVTLNYRDSELHMRIRLRERVARNVVVPVYIVCGDEDGTFQAPAGRDNSVHSARRRISLVTRLLQMLIAEKLVESELPRRTFAFPAHTPVGTEVHVFRSKIHVAEARAMSPEQLWEHFARELVLAWQRSPHVKFLAFLACTRYEGSPGDSELTHAQITARTRAHVALGGGGLAIFGTGCLHTWPQHLHDVTLCLSDATRVDQVHFMDDSCYRGTYGGCCATTVGSVLHELCHTFDLGHTVKGVMGRGFDHVERVFFPSPSAQSHYCIELHNSSGAVSNAHAQVRACDDDTFFTKSCAFLLAYHKWMVDNTRLGPGITFDDTSWTLRCADGLRVVEVREGPRQVVRMSWCFPVARLNFVVPRSALSDAQPPLLLVAQDNVGCLLRTAVTL